MTSKPDPILGHGATFHHYLKSGTSGEKEAARSGFAEGYEQGILRGESLTATPEHIVSNAPAAIADEKTEDVAEPQYYSSTDIGRVLGIGPTRVLQILVGEGVLLSDQVDDAIRYRPTEDYFSTGWFMRIERFVISEKRLTFQTAVTKRGREPVLDLLRAALPKYPLKHPPKSRPT